ncbi:MAG: GntR family transcriptional regulator [Chloroflexota bacterium]
MQWIAPTKPKDHAEHALLTAILDGTFAPGSALPGERTLAAQLGVTRPTLREAIQRLARDGWLTVNQGKQTVVNDYWEEGGLNVLGALVEHSDQLPPGFICQLLEVRLHLAPVYTGLAVAAHSREVADFCWKGSLWVNPRRLMHGMTGCCTVI